MAEKPSPLGAAGATWHLADIVGHGAADRSGPQRRRGARMGPGFLPARAGGAAGRARHRGSNRRDRHLVTRHTKTALLASWDVHPNIKLEPQAELFERPERMRRMTGFLERKHR